MRKKFPEWCFESASGSVPTLDETISLNGIRGTHGDLRHDEIGPGALKSPPKSKSHQIKTK
jgi:hypothetical protein